MRGKGLLNAIVIKEEGGVNAYDVCMKLKDAGLLVSPRLLDMLLSPTGAWKKLHKSYATLFFATRHHSGISAIVNAQCGKCCVALVWTANEACFPIATYAGFKQYILMPLLSYA